MATGLSDFFCDFCHIPILLFAILSSILVDAIIYIVHLPIALGILETFIPGFTI